MSAEEQFKADIIAKVQEGKLRAKEAQKLLQKSEETIRRYRRSYEKRGIAFVKHGNTSCLPWNKKSQEFIQEIRELIRERYFDVNACHLGELLWENHEIRLGREALRKILHQEGLLKKAHHRRRKPRQRRDRMPQRGLMVQLDGSPHEWFGGVKSCLIAAIDDATSDVLYGEFFVVEDTLSCMKVIQKIIEKFGIFQVLYVDRAGIFSNTKRRDFGQLARACEELGIQVIYAQSPEAKGRIERLFQTLQDRLCVELRLNKIERPEEANDYLQTVYLPKHNKKFAVRPLEDESGFKKCPVQELSQHFCLKQWRKIAKDHTISWNSKIYKVPPPQEGSAAGQKVEIRHYGPGRWQAYLRNRKISLLLAQVPLKIYPSYTDVHYPLKSRGNKPHRIAR